MIDKLKLAFQTVKDNFYKYGFLISSLTLAIIYFVFDKKNQTLQETLANTQAQLLEQKLQDIEARGKQSEDQFEKSNTEYDNLKRRHGALLERVLNNKSTGTPPKQ